jgi:hypothetical protein
MRILIAVVLVLSGCGKKDDPGVDWAGKDAEQDIPKLKAAIASAKPGDGIFKCAQMGNLDALKQSDTWKTTAAELEQLCTYDLQIAIMKTAVEAAEAARKAKPAEKVLSECYSAELKVANDELVKYRKIDDKAKALVARMAVACPDVTF